MYFVNYLAGSKFIIKTKRIVNAVIKQFRFVSLGHGKARKKLKPKVYSKNPLIKKTSFQNQPVLFLMQGRYF